MKSGCPSPISIISPTVSDTAFGAIVVVPWIGYGKTNTRHEAMFRRSDLIVRSPHTTLDTSFPSTRIPRADFFSIRSGYEIVWVRLLLFRYTQSHFSAPFEARTVLAVPYTNSPFALENHIFSPHIDSFPRYLQNKSSLRRTLAMKYAQLGFHTFHR